MAAAISDTCPPEDEGKCKDELDDMAVVAIVEAYTVSLARKQVAYG